MRSPFRNAWEIYTGKFEKILLLMITTTLPLLLLHSFATNYIYAITPAIGIHSVADIYYAFLTILLFFFAQVPYIRFVYNDFMGHENNLRDSFIQYLIQAFQIFIFSTVITVFAIIGFSLLIIPGFIILALFIPIPYISIIDEKSSWKAIKEGVLIGKKYFLKILLFILITGLLELFVGVFIMSQVFNITSSFAAQVITQITLNLLYFPIIVLLFTSFIIKWRQEQELLEVENEEKISHIG